jgi:hypothetical protein
MKGVVLTLAALLRYELVSVGAMLVQVGIYAFQAKQGAA